MESPRKLHPLVATAAVGVIIASLAATAAVTGWLPNASSSSSARSDAVPITQTAQQPAMDAVASYAPRARQSSGAAMPTPPVGYAQHGAGPRTEPQYAPPRAAACASCGTVESVVPVRREGHSTGLGAVGGAVAGGVIGNQFGGGGGRTAMTLLGALGGGLAGNSVEKHMRSETDYRVHVRMQNGKLRYFTYRQPPSFQPGERVQIENGALTHAG
ncbi:MULTISPECIES: glycine zipper 2TM domain-containing protein [Burkholderiaceae]|uniref:glycine zipper 2TM domain-containing protein n=1 Tax=Burkholderiaceae TaxID=119060 RepID=UPI00095CC13D|nr:MULTISPECIES: glycine zipper 2TM domain-containing protein [Burkholderiaceae]MCG1039665.1 glycine zipper 2TM domain-containing protein [Mycetohabitans sp. B7]SIT70418.1 Glycine zipper 2TM domain-containing protein [Burkholderia sp. b14]